MGDVFDRLVMVIFWLGRDEREMEDAARGILRRSAEGCRTNSVPIDAVLSDVIRERRVPLVEPVVAPGDPAWRWAERVLEASL